MNQIIKKKTIVKTDIDYTEMQAMCLWPLFIQHDMNMKIVPVFLCGHQFNWLLTQ